jgi:hypothetical protein
VEYDRTANSIGAANAAANRIGATRGKSGGYEGAAAGGSTTGGVAEGPATKQTAANTKSAADSLARSKEDLKYLRDVATRKAINRFTTAKIDLRFTANNTIKGKQDVDGVNNSIWDTLVRATNAMAEA